MSVVTSWILVGLLAMLAVVVGVIIREVDHLRNGDDDE